MLDLPLTFINVNVVNVVIENHSQDNFSEYGAFGNHMVVATAIGSRSLDPRPPQQTAEKGLNRASVSKATDTQWHPTFDSLQELGQTGARVRFSELVPKCFSPQPKSFTALC